MAQIKQVIQNRVVQREYDFEYPSATRDFPLGYQIQIVDDNSETTNPTVQVYEYTQAGQALVAFQPYTIQSSGSGIIAAICTNSVTAAAYERVCVPQTSVSNGSYAFVPVKGVVSCTHSSAVGVNLGVAGVQLEITNAATRMTPYTVSQSAATAATIMRQTRAAAFTYKTQATASAAIRVYLYGDPVIRELGAAAGAR